MIWVPYHSWLWSDVWGQSRLYAHTYLMMLQCIPKSKGAYLSLYAVEARRTRLCFVSRAKTGLGLLWCARPECHDSISWRTSNGRVSNCVQCFGGKLFFVGQVEAYSVVRWCRVRKGRIYGALIFSFLMWWIHAAMDLSDCPHMVRWICVCLITDENCGRYWVLTEFQIDVCRVILDLFQPKAPPLLSFSGM